MIPAQKYRRLPSRSGLLIRHSLWMQSDHLLRVRANPFSEQYRRYYFADIQALVLTELPGTAAFYWYAAAISFAFLGGLLVYSRHPVWGTLCGLLALLVFYFGWRVPNCSCYLKTSVGTDKLPAIRHLRAARKAVAMVLLEIEKIQGPLSRETLDAQLASGTAVSPAALPAISHYGGQLHWTLFALMLFHAALSAAIWFMDFYSTPLSVVSGAASAATLLLAILAVFKQHRSDMSRGVCWVVICTLVLYPLNGIANFAVSMYIGIQLASKGQKAGNTQAIINHPAFKIVRLADLTWFLVLGCIGLILLWLHQRTTHTPPPLVISENPDIQADGT
ncbi:MAG TPA: hypothetical protein VIX89_04015 [Bryobacteraceae bacterium]